MNARDRTSTLPAERISAVRQPRILVIEDDRYVRALLCDLLSDWGYEAHAAPSGREGLALFAPNVYDAVLTDLVMPEISGLDVVAGVRSRDRSVAVVMFTGCTDDLDGEGRRLGFSVLRKPLDIEGLRRALRECVSGSRGI